MISTLQTSRKFSVIASLRARVLSKRGNPGVGHQITALEEVETEIQEDPEGFGNIETDFSDAHRLSRSYDLEKSQQRDKIRQHVIRSKYFAKKKLPNFLTYAEKEHIRLLHNKDEEQWSVESLADSFPATTDIIRKVIKSNWKLSSAKRLESHDKAVSKNWDLLQKGEFHNQLPKELLEHLKKFVNRRKIAYQVVLPTKKEIAPTSKEFSSILGSSSRQPEPSDTLLEAPNVYFSQLSAPVNMEDETYLLDKVKDKRYIRIKELKEKNVTLEDSQLESTRNANEADTTDLSLAFAHKFADNEVVISKTDKKLYEMSSIKERVYIPRKLWRKGAIYRIDDCYYDDDGEFLYRVPGMQD